MIVITKELYYLRQLIIDWLTEHNVLFNEYIPLILNKNSNIVLEIKSLENFNYSEYLTFFDSLTNNKNKKGSKDATKK